MQLPAPEITPLTEPYWDGLADGVLRHQRCRACANAWLPPRQECPGCLGDDWDWEVAQGTGHVVSWVVYHHAFHEALVDRLPYNVALVELDEGPRLISNITDGTHEMSVGRRVELVVEKEGGVSVARFRST